MSGARLRNTTIGKQPLQAAADQGQKELRQMGALEQWAEMTKHVLDEAPFSPGKLLGIFLAQSA